MTLIGFLGEYFYTPDFEFPKKQELKITTQDLLDENVDEKYFLTNKIVKTILGNGTKNYIVKPTIDLPISKTLTATMAKNDVNTSPIIASLLFIESILTINIVFATTAAMAAVSMAFRSLYIITSNIIGYTSAYMYMFGVNRIRPM